MILDEAIKHAEEVAEEHRQLAEWLKELKMYREMMPSASKACIDKEGE